MPPPPLTILKERVLDILFPPQCLKCAVPVAQTGTLCSLCWQDISFIDGPACYACGLPFEFDLGPAALCGACYQTPPLFERARAVMIYNAASRDLVLAFKHGDQTHAAVAYGNWLHRAGQDLAAASDLIVPVPLHWSRLYQRRYNQAAMLAIAVAKLADKPVATNLLRRPKNTASQGHKTVHQRQQNLRGAFTVAGRADTELKHRHVLLIDDVFTTGATVSACAKTLLRAGASHVDVLTLARVVRTEINPTSPNSDPLL